MREIGRLLGPESEDVLSWLRHAPLHGGLAAELVDDSGVAVANAGDASLSGLLAWAAWYAVHALGVEGLSAAPHLPAAAICDLYLAQHAGIAQLVEHNLAKVGVAGSSPVSRSGRSDGGAAAPPFRVDVGVARRDGETGRRARLKISCPKGRPGSSPGPGIGATR